MAGPAVRHMPGDSNGAIAAARQRTQRRQRMRHSDTNGTIASMISRQLRHHRGHRRPPRIFPPAPLLSRNVRILWRRA
jgi:hypothetical protein